MRIGLYGGWPGRQQRAYFIDGARAGLRLGHTSMKDSVVHDGLWDAFNDYHMGIIAENLAQKYAISRERQDASLRSSQKAAAAMEAGRFADEITPVSVPQGKKPPRHCGKYRRTTTFRDATGKTSATETGLLSGGGKRHRGNPSSINDGAAAVMLMRASKAAELGLPVLARVAGYAVFSGVDPAFMGIGSVAATRECLKRCGWTLEDIDLS
ncbi:hypothetical protein ACLBR5_20180 [Escherichia coli]